MNPITMSIIIRNLMVEKNDPKHWIRLGQSFQRFGLKAAKYNVSHAHGIMPCEELQVRENLYSRLSIERLDILSFNTLWVFRSKAITTIKYNIETIFK